MDKYSDGDVENLATDPAFRRWVLEPADGDNARWEEWMIRNPEQAGAVHQARLMVLAIQQRFGDELTEADIDLEIAALIGRVGASVSVADEAKEAKVISPVWRRYWWQVAAAVLLAVTLGWYWQYSAGSGGSPAYQSMQQETVPLTEKENRSRQPVSIRLSDGSTVVMEPGSRLRYPEKFTGKRREVYLSGEAFFQVAKNSYQPFLVYANQTVTKVLGTSFRIKAFDKAQTVSVAVKTGRVSFYAAKEYEKLQREDQPETRGVILTPNQRGMFHLADKRLEKGLVEQPELLSAGKTPAELVFEDRPVSEVLQLLERSYGIDILYDEEALARCPITTTFGDESLYERLSLICQAIGSAYEVTDGQVIINSNQQNCTPQSPNP
jgi:ferric-dicitrate binding protein FerR (iron transport regulator)